MALRTDLDTLHSRLAESQADFEAFLHMVRDDIHRLLDQLQAATDNAELPHLASQIAELADIAHLLIATGQVEEITNVDTNSLVEGILDSFHDWIEQAGVRIEIGPLPACFADANLLTRIFVELMDNALKFLSPDRPGRVAITAWTQDHQWLCQIEDNGIGMAPDQIDRAFEFGVQLAAEYPRTRFGPGLRSQDRQPPSRPYRGRFPARHRYPDPPGPAARLMCINKGTPAPTCPASPMPIIPAESRHRTGNTGETPLSLDLDIRIYYSIRIPLSPA